MLGVDDIGTIAVACFFLVSGYLVTGSRLSLPLARFAWHRALRIFPGLWVALLVIALVLAPLSTLLAGTYDVGSGVRYVLGDMSAQIHQPWIPGTLPGVPFAPDGAAPWDGSLWTLTHEVTCYEVLALWLLVPAMRRRAAPTSALLAVLTGCFAAGVFGRSDQLLWLSTFFVAGAVLRMFDERLPLNAGLALASALSAAVLTGAGHLLFAALPLGYLLLWIAARVPRRMAGWRTDYSYGCYIYAFPVQQVLALAGIPRFGLLAFVGASALATAPLAAASWWTVERRALALRQWTPDLPWSLASRSGVVSAPARVLQRAEQAGGHAPGLREPDEHAEGGRIRAYAHEPGEDGEQRQPGEQPTDRHRGDRQGDHHPRAHRRAPVTVVRPTRPCDPAT
jgi:peptidoglycan/LPS O-acetylase OafA/YrhL